MTSKRGAVLGVVVGTLAINGCCKCPTNGVTPQVAKDSEVRTWIRDELEPYLLLVAKELCRVKNVTAPNVGVPDLCQSVGDPEGVKPPKPNGNP